VAELSQSSQSRPVQFATSLSIDTIPWRKEDGTTEVTLPFDERDTLCIAHSLAWARNAHKFDVVVLCTRVHSTHAQATQRWGGWDHDGWGGGTRTCPCPPGSGRGAASSAPWTCPALRGACTHYTAQAEPRGARFSSRRASRRQRDERTGIRRSLVVAGRRRNRRQPQSHLDALPS
jgi:hypothetical protein